MLRALAFPLMLALLMALGGSTAVTPALRELHHGAAPNSGDDGFSRGLVSITFDDGWVSQYRHALPVLKEHGIPATHYIISGCVNVDPACMNRAELQVLMDRGDEIGSHTASHPNLTKIAASERNFELQRSQTALRQMLGPVAAADFAAPFGKYDDSTIATAQRFYASQRSTDSGFNTKSGFNRYKLVGQNVLAHTPPEMVQGWIESARANRYWLILVYHEVGENRNGGVFHVDTDTFQAEMRSVVDSGLATVTVRQGLEEVTRQLRAGGS